MIAKQLRDNSRYIPSLVVTSILIVALIMNFFKFLLIIRISLTLFLIAHIIAIFYAIFIGGLSRLERMIILTISIFPFFFYLFKITHWPGISILGYLLFLSIGAFVYSSFRLIDKLKYEFPFLGIMALYALLGILT